MVISTGITFPRWASVAALYCRQKSMMLTPWGPSAVPTGGAGVACPAGSCTFTTAAIRLLGGIAPEPYLSDLRYLIERKLDRRLPAEDRHQHLELLRVGVDLADGRRERGKRAVHYGNRLAKDRKSTRLNSSHVRISYAVFCLKKKKKNKTHNQKNKKKKKKKKKK